MERLYDLLTLLILFFITIIILGISYSFFPYMYIVSGGIICIFVVIYILKVNQNFRSKIISFLSFLSYKIIKRGETKINDFFHEFFNSLNNITNINLRNLGIITTSIIIWLLDALLFYSIFIAIGIEASYFVALFVTSIVSLGIMIPSAPGHIGVFEWVFIFGLGLFAIDSNLALAASLTVHAVLYIAISVIGILSLASMNISVKKILKR